MARGDAGVVVTEYGADLRGVPPDRRFERLLAIAHPGHGAALAAEPEEQLTNGAVR